MTTTASRLRAAPFKPHTLIVAGYVDENEGLDEREFTIECPGIEAGDCGAYAPCDVKDCPAEGLSWSGEAAHGAEHFAVDGQWMVPTAECYYLTFGADSLPDVAVNLTDGGVGLCLIAGRYGVIPEYMGDGDYHLDLCAVAV